MTDTADTATTDTSASVDAATTDTGAADTIDYKAEAEKWKTQARKHEERAKANSKAATELEEVRRQSMSEMEAAVDRAKSEARAETVQQFGSRLALEAVRAATVGRVADVDALLEGVDASRFLTDEGEPDRDAIAAWVDRIAPRGDDEAQHDVVRTLDLGQGARGTTKTVVDPLEQALTNLSQR